MPFVTTTIPPLTSPRVTITFSGLMVIRAGPNNTCEVGVHRFSRDHVLQVLLIVKKPNLPPLTVPLLGGFLTSQFLIRFAPDPNPQPGNFLAFAQQRPFTRNPNTDDLLDFRWAVNLRDPQIHPNVDTNEGVQPSVILETGVLYTPHLTRANLSPRLVRQGSPDIPLNRLAANLAASISLNGRRLLLNWRDRGDRKDVLLPRDGDPLDTTYTVSFINDPPDLDTVLHDELVEYYRVLHIGNADIPGAQRFSLVYSNVIRTDEVPCLTTVLAP